MSVRLDWVRLSHEWIRWQVSHVYGCRPTDCIKAVEVDQLSNSHMLKEAPVLLVIY